MPGVWRVLSYVGVIVVLALFAGKLLGLPVALMIVYGSSMEPSLKPFDLVLGVHPDIVGGVGRGDVVVWCDPGDVWRTSCVVHRVIDVRGAGGENIVITKGDALTYPDPPVRLSRVSYVVVAHAPNLVTLLLLTLIYVIGIIYHSVYLPYISHRRRLIVYPGTIALLLVIYYVITNTIYIGSGMLDTSPTTISFPRLYREDLSFNTYSGLVNISLSYNSSLSPINSPKCGVIEPINASLIPEKFTIANGSANIIIRIPPNVFQELWRIDSKRVSSWSLPSPPAKVSTSILLSCVLRFNGGILKSTYSLKFNWIEPVAKPYGDDKVVVENHNPVPINASVEVYSYYQDKVIYRESIVLKPFTNNIIDLPKTGEGDVLVVYIHYVFLGHVRSIGVVVHA
ncbi:hypothetical protein [Staphylothermus hellenicus]|uniref:Peptidase S26B, signal peptidase n=1 Tax=Staphylothermus hellenicus (strain DSM 12710 / JCM 10830 / BK20S6-10-b1 / P8) TaxID=591019 RepID=D7DAY5_STAHD|nr:hypothetical protein [Staphylothermus hellenicus]ADI31332.1 peptidase S26B, signal peptidase [Staphylothermus hellenicus DSM 12710]